MLNIKILKIIKNDDSNIQSNFQHFKFTKIDNHTQY